MDEKVEKLLNWIRQSPTVTHDRFFVLASEYGINRALASDLWFLRPIEHVNDCEDQVAGNMALLRSTGDWIQRNNLLALQLQRHAFEPGQLLKTSGPCARCKAPFRTAIHNLEPDSFKTLEGSTSEKTQKAIEAGPAPGAIEKSKKLGS